MPIYVNSNFNYKENNKSMYQKAPPVMNMLSLPKSPQICPSDWETSKVLTKSQQNLKKNKVWRNGSSNLPDSNVPKGPTHSELY